jgi:hypothetical protein
MTFGQQKFGNVSPQTEEFGDRLRRHARQFRRELPSMLKPTPKEICDLKQYAPIAVGSTIAGVVFLTGLASVISPPNAKPTESAQPAPLVSQIKISADSLVAKPFVLPDASSVKYYIVNAPVSKGK